jgi:hypothetical protein
MFRFSSATQTGLASFHGAVFTCIIGGIIGNASFLILGDEGRG